MHDSDNFCSLDFRETSYFSATRFSNSTIMFCHNLKDILKFLSNLFDNDVMSWGRILKSDKYANNDDDDDDDDDNRVDYL